MSEEVQQTTTEEAFAQSERLKRNLGVVCRAVVAAGGSKVTGTMVYNGDEEEIELDHDLPTDDLYGDDCGAVSLEEESGFRDLCLGDALNAVMSDLSHQIIELRLDNWKLEATLDAEQARLSAQSFAQEEFDALRSELRSVITHDASQPQTPSDIAMHRVYSVAREVFYKQSKFISDMPGVLNAEQADAWNRSVVLSAMKRAGIEQAILSYTGSGDRGDKWELRVEGLDGDALERRLTSRVAMCLHDCHGPMIMQQRDIKLELATNSLKDAIDVVAEHLIAEHHFGYEESQGAGGKIVFDVVKADILWSAFDWEDRYVPRKHILIDAAAPTAGMRP